MPNSPIHVIKLKFPSQPPSSVGPERGSELEWFKDLQETKSYVYELPPPAHNSLFSLYLRSQSPSRSSAKGICDNDRDGDGSLPSQTVTPGDICLSTAEDIHLADSID